MFNCYEANDDDHLKCNIVVIFLFSLCVAQWFFLQVKILEDLVLSYTESLKERSLFNKDGELR